MRPSTGSNANKGSPMFKERWSRCDNRLRIVERNGLDSTCRSGLKEQAILAIEALAAGESLLTYVGSKWPDFVPFTDHPAYCNGIFSCEVRPEGTATYSPNSRAFLNFHSDMSLHPQPPGLTIIRCLYADDGPPGSGANLLIHIDDALRRLQDTGRADLLNLLQKPTPLTFTDGNDVVCPLVSPDRSIGALRVFDRIGAHLDVESRPLLHEFVDLCRTWHDLQIEIRLNPGDVLVISNRDFLHAREQCAGYGRLTEICLGTLSDNQELLSDEATSSNRTK